MTVDMMNELMIVAISRAAQLAYVEESSEAFAYLSAADRFLRYHASSDKTATLGEELERLADLATLDASFALRVEESVPSISIFIQRLSLIDAALELAGMPGGTGPIAVEIAAREDGPACVLSRGAEKRLVARA